MFNQTFDDGQGCTVRMGRDIEFVSRRRQPNETAEFDIKVAAKALTDGLDTPRPWCPEPAAAAPFLGCR